MTSKIDMIEVFKRLKAAELSKEAANEIVEKPETISDADEILSELKKVLATKADLRAAVDRLIAEQKKTRFVIMVNFILIALLILANNTVVLNNIAGLLGIDK
ncbi:hypothetical protein [Candidatus Magnetomonas plexicatena]|uniref:hypothetical protein n=1 Tax=Candidatus Magnetomonas plexicatena TaxID=2552947 RepID=UPI001102EBE1|nr:hypothetical protein E2O03_008210 [Nitrospirales bacterium LBB_01]